MPVATSYAVGAYAAGEGSLAIVGRGYQPDGTKRGVLLCHSASASALTAIDGNPTMYGSGLGIATALALAGYPVLSCTLGGGATWGNDTAIARLTDAWTYLKGTLGAKTDKALIYGVSMGCLTALNWAKANLASVAAIALHLPVVNLADIHDNNRGGLAAGIEGAYGGAAGYAAAVSTHDPAQAAAALAALRMKLWYASNDPLIPTSVVDSFSSAVAAEVASLGAVGHDATTLDPTSVVGFLRRYA